ncbi:MAG TPA: AMP-binding protein [Nitriliruptorales bacterium]
MTAAPARGIHDLAAAEPDRVALISDRATWTFADLEAATNRFATAYASAGVGQGERVAVRLTNRNELFAAWAGAARVGALVVPISYRFTVAESRHLVADSGARVLVHEDTSLAVAATDGLDVTGVAVDEVDGLLATPPNEDFLGTPVMWMTYTSGTTGQPKGIVRPTPQPMRETPPQPYMQFWGFGRDDVHVLTGPAYHTAPGAWAWMHLVEGAPVVVMERFDAARFLELVAEHRATNSHMVPANFVRLLELPSDVREAADLSSIRRIIHGAAPCPPAVKRGVIDLFPEGTVWEYYGASEGMGTVISPDEWLDHEGSVGRAFPGLETVILDEQGQPVPDGEVGRVHISAVPGFEFAYHQAPDKTAEAWSGSHFTVGDLGWMDEDGYVYLADRRTDLILRGGVNVYPAEIEAALVEHDVVVDAAVIGLPDERLGQRVHAILEAPGDLDEEELRAFLAERLADFKIPASFEMVEELPREPTGKVSRARLRAERM